MRENRPKMTEEEIASIERILNQPGVSSAEVKIEKGKIVVLQVEKKRIV